ncbi:hypothetical protein GOODEAATRI_004092, partial [Goodea atripinnis]
AETGLGPIRTSEILCGATLPNLDHFSWRSANSPVSFPSMSEPCIPPEPSDPASSLGTNEQLADRTLTSLAPSLSLADLPVAY